MSFFSDFYVDKWNQDIINKFIILLNQTKIYNKEKYLLIVAQDMKSKKIVRLIDFHGKKYDLYKFQENWAQLKKGDVIKVRCAFHESINCANVLRVISDFEIIDSLDYYKIIHDNPENVKVLSSNKQNNLDEIKANLILFPKKTDLEYLAKKINGRYAFVLYPLYNSKLVEYTTKNKITKYQFIVQTYFNKLCYADIVSYVKDINLRIGDLYTGFVLTEFKYNNNRLRLKIYDFSNEDKCFKEPKNFDDFDELKIDLI